MLETTGTARKRSADQVTEREGTRNRPFAPLRVLLGALATALVGLGLTGQTALGLTTHNFAMEINVGGNCGQASFEGSHSSPHDLTTDGQGNLYVMCCGKGANGLWGSIKRFHPDGTPFPF